MNTVIRRTLLFALVTVGTARAQSSAPALQSPETTLEQRFASALTYDKFVAGDTARRDEWNRNYANAATAVAAVDLRAKALAGHWHLLVVAESWCGDAVNSVPYLARLAAQHPAFDLRILRKAEAKDLLDANPLDGRSATPLVLVLDDAFVPRGVWIERPAVLGALIKAKEARTCEDALAAEVSTWRRVDGGRSVLGEVLALMERAAGTANQQQTPQPTTAGQNP